MIPSAFYVDDEIGEVPVVTVLEPMPEDGTGVVIGDESGEASLWIDWVHHGAVSLSDLPTSDGGR